MPLRVLHYSDVENAYDDPDRIGRLAGLVADLRDEDTLVAGTGDNTGPGVLALVTEGRQSLDFFDAVSPDVETFGNHDFDFGLDRTRELVRDSPQTWVSANVHLNGSRFGNDDGVVPHTVVERNDTRVGVFGVTDADTPAMNPTAADLRLTDPHEAAARAVDALRDEGVDHVVALSHLGRGDEELAVEVDVDAVLGGHVHSERVERVNDTLLTRPGANGHVLLELVFENGDVDVVRHEVADAPLDESVADALRDRMAAAGLDDVVGHAPEPLERSSRTVYRGESRIGNFVADAYRWAADADVGLQNSGGIREGPALDGAVRVRDLISVVPFDEPVAVAELTGAELRELLRQGSGRNLGFGEPEWWHAHVSGASLVWDHTHGELEDVRVAGEPVDPDATYTVATTDYLFFTDHEFPVLTTDHRVARLDTQYEVLAAYAREFGVEAGIEGRIRRRGLPDGR
ncbi:bifunctional metallophosphatase/5'-nucleotidase [Halobacteriaceae archaeon GCM10025711]